MAHSIYDKYLELEKDGAFTISMGRGLGKTRFYEEYLKYVELMKEREMQQGRTTNIDQTITNEYRLGEPVVRAIREHDEYLLLDSTTHQDLTNQVQQKLNEGFRVHGVTTITVVPMFSIDARGNYEQSGAYVLYNQAVTRKATN